MAAAAAAAAAFSFIISTAAAAGITTTTTTATDISIPFTAGSATSAVSVVHSAATTESDLQPIDVARNIGIYYYRRIKSMGEVWR